MPRTRQVKKTEVREEPPTSCNQKEATLLLEEYTTIYNKIKNELLEQKESTLTALRLLIKQDMLSIPVSLGNKTIRELKQGGHSIWQNLSSISSYSMVNSMLHPRTNCTTKKISANDEGYLTSESRNGTSGGTRPSRTLRRSSSCSSRLGATSTAKKPTRSSRSSSRLKVPESSNTKSKKVSRSLSRKRPSTLAPDNKFRTPQNTRHLESYGMVTPKVKPNTPHVILRRPQQGEMAISMQGSPLMTSAMVTETTANLNIPLPDGRMINIQPLKGLRPSTIPQLDAETQKQLQTLRENLEIVCKFARNK